MKTSPLFSPFLLLALIALGCSSQPKVETAAPLTPAAHPASFAELKAQFADPPSEFRSAPLWVWNDKVTVGEIDSQLVELKEAGIGGVFIHPRPGLITAYLSEDWHALCRHTVEKGKELGMQVWLYDENSYPSGFAGGHVPAEMPESYNQGQGLVFHRAETLPQPLGMDCPVVLKRQAEGFVDISGALQAEAGKKGDYYLFEKAFYGKDPWFGGFTYVDLLLPGVTEKFIEVTMRGYEKGIGDEFGRNVRGIFTDEPNVAPPAKDCIRWTPALFAEFQKRFGYDLVTVLPALFEEVGPWQRVRHDYYALLLDLFIQHWSKPWNAYCEAHHLLWTGHYWEHGWPSPQHCSDNMAMYAWHDVPSIDILMNTYSEDVNAQFGNVRAVKELASAANQTGRNRKLSETYGAGGWDLRFEDMKRIGDWEYALGVNFMNQHLTYMTIFGARKRDHPQSFSYHEPWWKDYRVLCDYFARLSLALSTGNQVNRTLVLEPTSTAWMYYSPVKSAQRFSEIGDSFQTFLLDLEKMQLEYDLGCEKMMQDRGRAEAGRLSVGERSYDLLVLPPNLENLERPTFDILRRYLETGGVVLSFGGAPRCLDGVGSDSVKALAEQYEPQWVTAASPQEAAALERLTAKDFRFDSPESAGGKLFHQRRTLAEGELVFLVNTSLEESATGSFRAAGGSVQRLDPEAGAISPYRSDKAGDGLNVQFDLPPAGSLLLYIDPAVSPDTTAAEPVAAGAPVPPVGGWTVERLSPNVLTLDYCDVTVGGQELKDCYFFNASDAIFRHYGFEGDPWSGAVQFKTSIVDRDSFPAGSGFEAGFAFRVEPGVASGSMQAVLEHPELWEVAVNGQTVNPRPGEWSLDRSFGLYDIGAAVVSGQNSLSLHAAPMTVHSELEPVYILGDFGLEPYERGWKVVSPRELSFGAWTAKSLPFYSGGVSYKATFDLKEGAARCRVRLGKWLGSVAEVTVNGQAAGTVGWPPYERDISALVKPGRNEVAVTVYGTLKNQLGPHHNKPEHGRAWPAAFRAAPEHQPDGAEYDFIGYGLFEPFSVLVQP
ncbi:hypothetical protein LLH00_06125 [bacterium]|nr:hypothetical protein [bacterium]